VETSQSVFLRGITSLELPVAHGEGRVVVRDPALIESWRQKGQIALCYRPGQNGLLADEPADQRALLPFPHNPNGSVANIAGLADPSGRVFGLMPHPERFLHATQHPQWTRRQLTGAGEGLRIFQNAVDYFA
jgi:phosphoribosylformylglycinamidine synthase subunit PurQ / glutaminase